MMLIKWTKQPIEVKDYDILMEKFLEPSGDKIYGVTTSVRAPAGDLDPLRVRNILFTDDTVKLWIVGGTNKTQYTVEVTVETEQGRIDQSEITFIVKEI